MVYFPKPDDGFPFSTKYDLKIVCHVEVPAEQDIAIPINK